MEYVIIRLTPEKLLSYFQEYNEQAGHQINMGYMIDNDYFRMWFGEKYGYMLCSDSNTERSFDEKWFMLVPTGQAVMAKLRLC